MKNLFCEPGIIALIGDTNEAKSNTIYYLLASLKANHEFELYTYGLRKPFPHATSIYTIQELESIKNSIIIIDEFCSIFDLDNRKQKSSIENTLRLVFHNNNIVLLCGLPENFKKFISAKIHKFMFKKCTFDDFINGSTSKKVALNYRGLEAGSVILNLSKSEVLVFDGAHYKKLVVPYMYDYDTKKDNEEILKDKNVPVIVSGNVQEKEKD